MQNTLYQQRNLVVSPKLITFCTVAVFLYALTKFWIGTKISAYFEAAFLLPFYYIVFKNWWFFKKSKFTWLCIAMLVVPILQFLVQYYQNPELAMKYQGVDKLFKLTFFIAAAFWLSYNLRLVSWFIVANIIGLSILFLSQENLERLINLTLSGIRTSWGEINAQFAAMYASIGIIALACLVPTSLKQANPWVKITLLSFITITTTLFLFVIFASQTRAAIGGLIVSALAGSLLFAQHEKFSLKKIIKSPVSLITFLCTFLLFGAVLNQPTISKKISKEWTKISSNKQGILPDQFGGGRGELWKFGYKKIVEKPILGWGGESRTDLIPQAEELSARTRKGLWHMHNSWLEFGLVYGLLGIVLLTTLIALIFEKTRKAWNKNQLPSYIAAFTLLTLIFTCFINLFESYLFFWQGGYLLIWTCTPPFAYLLHKQIVYRPPLNLSS